MSIEMNGMIIGALASSTATMGAAYAGPTWQEHAEGVGFATGVLVSSLLLISPNTRKGAYYGMGAAAFTSGFRYLFRLLVGAPAELRLPAAPAPSAQLPPQQPTQGEYI